MGPLANCLPFLVMDKRVSTNHKLPQEQVNTFVLAMYFSVSLTLNFKLRISDRNATYLTVWALNISLIK